MENRKLFIGMEFKRTPLGNDICDYFHVKKDQIHHSEHLEMKMVMAPWSLYSNMTSILRCITQ